MTTYDEFCNNCGKFGHNTNDCKMPITSIGIILFRYMDDKLQYLMIRRKDSFGFVDFIRGKYGTNNDIYLRRIIDEMTISEKDKILNRLSNDDDDFSRNLLKRVKANDMSIDIPTITKYLTESRTSWRETEWGFPKGRRNNMEKDLDCALREFEEETGYKRNSIQIVDNILPYEEYFIGSNNKSYKHKYYIAFTDKCTHTSTTYQKSEVSKIAWVTYDNAISIMRDYNYEKKDVLSKVNNVITQYRLSS
jgi:8-oxo-dGTP pyrophosphatase MutT (NUDIX family)